MGQRQVNGAAVRAIRTALGLKQAELAAAIGKNAGYLCRIELGTQRVHAPATQRLLADALGVPLAAITSVVQEGDAA